MAKTPEEKLNELRELHAEIERKLNNANVEFQNYGAAVAGLVAIKLRELANKCDTMKQGYKEFLEMN